MKLIPLTQGKFAMVDDEDYDFLNQFKWHAHFDKWNWYALRWEKYKKGKRKSLKMHRVIMDVKNADIKVDHKDRNGLNNQKENLRLCSMAENSRNTFKQLGTVSKYLGVSRVKTKKPNGKIHSYWIARIGVNYKRIYLGVFKTEELAAVAYNKAAKKYHGEFATLNFK